MKSRRVFLLALPLLISPAASALGQDDTLAPLNACASADAMMAFFSIKLEAGDATSYLKEAGSTPFFTFRKKKETAPKIKEKYLEYKDKWALTCKDNNDCTFTSDEENKDCAGGSCSICTGKYTYTMSGYMYSPCENIWVTITGKSWGGVCDGKEHPDSPLLVPCKVTVGIPYKNHETTEVHGECGNLSGTLELHTMPPPGTPHPNSN